jgi:hypothetical protein
LIKFGCFRNNLAENKNEKKQDKEIIYFKKASGHSKDFVDEKEVYSSDYFASKKESRKSPKIKKDAETKIDIDEKTFKWKLICLLGKIRKIEDSFPTLFTQEIEINLPFMKHLKAAFSKLSSFWKLIFQHLPEFIEQTKVFFKDHVHLLFKSTKENYERIDSALTQNNKVQTIISWKTDEQATSILSYREGRIGEEKEFSNTDSLFTNHVIVMTSFKSGTVYNFRVKSTDAAGNESISGYFSFLTPRVKENIIQIITNNFMEIFGWAGTIGK